MKALGKKRFWGKKMTRCLSKWKRNAACKFKKWNHLTVIIPPLILADYTLKALNFFRFPRDHRPPTDFPQQFLRNMQTFFGNSFQPPDEKQSPHFCWKPEGNIWVQTVWKLSLRESVRLDLLRAQQLSHVRAHTRTHALFELSLAGRNHAPHGTDATIRQRAAVQNSHQTTRLCSKSLHSLAHFIWYRDAWNENHPTVTWKRGHW